MEGVKYLNKEKARQTIRTILFYSDDIGHTMGVGHTTSVSYTISVGHTREL